MSGSRLAPFAMTPTADALAASRLLATAYPAKLPCRVYYEVISSTRPASTKLSERRYAAWNGSKKLEGRMGTLEQGQYQGEIWVQRALAGHPWRVSTPSQADILFLGTNVTLLCESGDAHGAAQRRSNWMNSKLANDPNRPPAGGETACSPSGGFPDPRPDRLGRHQGAPGGAGVDR